MINNLVLAALVLQIHSDSLKIEHTPSLFNIESFQLVETQKNKLEYLYAFQNFSIDKTVSKDGSSSEKRLLPEKKNKAAGSNEKSVQKSTDISPMELENVELYIFLADFALNNKLKQKELEYIAIQMDEITLTASEKDVFADKLAKRYETNILFADYTALKSSGLISSEFPYALKKGILIIYHDIAKKENGSVCFSIEQYVSGKGSMYYMDAIATQTQKGWIVENEGMILAS